MILAVQAATLVFGMIFVYGGCWLVSKVSTLINRAEEIYDRADQILGAVRLMPPVTGPRPQWGEAALPHQTWVQTGSSKDGEKPRPTPGPATVPTGEAIDAGLRAVTGRHARSEG